MDEKLKNACIAFSCGDGTELFGYLTDDTLWHNVGKETLKGSKTIEAVCREMQKQPVYLQVSSQFEGTNHLVVEGHGEAENQFCFCDIFEFEQGKILAIKSYLIAQQGE